MSGVVVRPPAVVRSNQNTPADLDSRSGLKRVHNNFEEIQRNLVAAYTKYTENDKVVGGIVGIWSKMSGDAILRNKIFHAGTFTDTHIGRSTQQAYRIDAEARAFA